MLPSVGTEEDAAQVRGGVPVADEVALREGGLAQYDFPDSMLIHRAHGAPVRGAMAAQHSSHGLKPSDGSGGSTDTINSTDSVESNGMNQPYSGGMPSSSSSSSSPAAAALGQPPQGPISRPVGPRLGLGPSLSVTTHSANTLEAEPGRPMGLPRFVRDSEPFRDETLESSDGAGSQHGPGGAPAAGPRSGPATNAGAGGGAGPESRGGVAMGVHMRSAPGAGATANGRGPHLSSEKRLLAARDSLGQPPLVDFSNSGSSGSAGLGGSGSNPAMRPNRAKSLRRARKEPRELGESKFERVNRSREAGAGGEAREARRLRFADDCDRDLFVTTFSDKLQYPCEIIEPAPPPQQDPPPSKSCCHIS